MDSQKKRCLDTSKDIKTRIKQLEKSILNSVPYDNWGVGSNCSKENCKPRKEVRHNRYNPHSIK